MFGEFAERGLVSKFVQTNHSYNRKRGTLRGMHFQRAPHAEVKLVRCVQGAIHDIIVDLRPDSPTYMAWEGFDLSAENGRELTSLKASATASSRLPTIRT